MHASRSLKILGLLLALVGLMAVTASGAQAKWLMLKDKVSVLELKLEAEVLLGELKSESGIEIHCKKGSGTGTLKSSADHKTVTGEATVSFSECKVLNNPNCTVTVHPASGTGELKMEGAKVYIEASKKHFTDILFSGPFCTLPEEEEVNGTVWLTVLNPLEDAVTHLVDVDEARDGSGNSLLTLGESKAELLGELLPEGRDPFVLAHVKTTDSKPWAIHLVEL